MLAAFALLLAAAAVAGVAWKTLGEVSPAGDGGTAVAAEAGGVASAHEQGPVQEQSPVRRRRPEPRPNVVAAPAVSLEDANAFEVKLRKPLRAGLVMDLDSGAVLWRRHAMRPVPMASLTKIMTALLVTERGLPRDPVRITPAALRYQGSGVGLLPLGKRVRLETLLNGLLLVSGNDAAIALAVHVAGSERRFVALMNRRAREWGLACTRFASAHGLEDGNRSCARDLAVLTRLAMRRPRIRRIARRTQASFRFPIKGKRLWLTGHNPLLRLGYPGAIGLKTGYTDAAGRCFVGVARRDGRTLAVVMLGAHDPSLQAPRLLDAAFQSL